MYITIKDGVDMMLKKAMPDSLTNRLRSIAVALTLLTSTFLLAACGPSSEGGASDTAAPTISSTSPEKSATTVALNSIATATFNKDIFAKSVDDASFTLKNSVLNHSGAVSGIINFDALTNTISFTPNNNLDVLTSYTASLSTSITDLNGNPLDTNYEWSFTTIDGTLDPAELIGIETDIASDVPSSQLRYISDGFKLAEQYYAKVIGLTLSEEQKDMWKIKIVATGEGEFGSCCVANDVLNGGYIFFDVKHPNWINADPIYRGQANSAIKIVVHEFTHGIQYEFKVIGSNGNKLPNWMTEGMGEYFAYEAMIWNKEMNRQDVEQFMASAAAFTKVLAQPLEDFIPSKGHPWAGHIGYLAVIGLVEQSGDGAMSLINYMQYLQKEDWDHAQAFEEAFKISTADFYSQFETYRLVNINLQNPDPRWNN